MLQQKNQILNHIFIQMKKKSLLILLINHQNSPNKKENMITDEDKRLFCENVGSAFSE